MSKMFVIGSCAVLAFLMLPVILSSLMAFLLTGVIPGTNWVVSPDIIILLSMLSLTLMIIYPQRVRIAAKLTQDSFRNRLPTKRFN